MNGPEHYAEAERLLAESMDSNPETPYFMAYAARAQVHATLALTAATAEAAFDPQGQHLARSNGWDPVLS